MKNYYVACPSTKCFFVGSTKNGSYWSSPFQPCMTTYCKKSKFSRLFFTFWRDILRFPHSNTLNSSFVAVFFQNILATIQGFIYGFFQHRVYSLVWLSTGCVYKEYTDYFVLVLINITLFVWKLSELSYGSYKQDQTYHKSSFLLIIPLLFLSSVIKTIFVFHKRSACACLQHQIILTSPNSYTSAYFVSHGFW